jgi:basic membrane protein A
MALRVAALLFGAPGSGSFIQSAERGLREAVCSTDVSLTLAHCTSTNPTDRVHALESLARHGADLIIVHGGQGSEPLSKVAPQWPLQRFAITQGEFMAPNVAAYEVCLEPVAELAGALAAWSSRSGVIGHLSGEKVGPGIRGRDAYLAGARKAMPSIRILTEFCGNQHDPALAQEKVTKQIEQGADIVFTMLGSGREGAIEACRIAGAWQIGDGTDWCEAAPDVFLASVFADAAWCCRQAITDLKTDQLALGQRRQMSTENPQVCRLILNPVVPFELRRRLATWEATEP